jgi:multidrug resistance efflux pump
MAEAEASRRERARVRASLRQADRRLASMESKLRRARARIVREQQATGSSEQMLHRLNAAEAKISAAKGSLDETRRRDSPVSDLQARSMAINKELDEIDTLVDLVSDSGF